MAKILIADNYIEKQLYAELGAVHDLKFATSFAQAMLISRKNNFDLFVCNGTFLLACLGSETIAKINVNRRHRNPMAILLSGSMGLGTLSKMGLAVATYSMKDGQSRVLEINNMSPSQLAASIEGCLPENQRKLPA